MVRKPNQPFEVIITRSASQTVVLRVDAQSQEAAEDAIHSMLGQSHRVTLEEIRESGYHVVEDDFYPDDESSWEVM